jgi:hypothetical protein
VSSALTAQERAESATRELTHRPEDQNCTQMFDAFPDGATLAELEAFTRLLRDRGAPDDARPRVKLNEHLEVIGLVCTVERHPEINRLTEVNRR